MNSNNIHKYGTSFGSGSFTAPNQYQQMGPMVQGGSSSSSSSSNKKNNRYDQYGGQGGPGPYEYGKPHEDSGCLKNCCLACGALVCCCCVADCLT